MSRLSVTRMSLLGERSRIATARRGVEVLKSKRDALVREFHVATREALEFRHEISGLASRAARGLVRALGLVGPSGLRSLAVASRREVRVEIDVRNLWGVRMPTVGSRPAVRPVGDRGYGVLATSVAVDELAESHERLIAFALEQAPREIRLRRLAAELRRTTRKVNRIERDVLPRLGANVRRIAMALEEQEREERARLQVMRKPW